MRFGRCHDLSGGVQHQMLAFYVQLGLLLGCRVFAIVGHGRVDEDAGLPAFDFRPHEGAVWRYVDGMGLDQMHVAIDASTLVVPTLLDGHVRAYGNDVLATVVQVGRDVVALTRVPLSLFSNEEPVDEDACSTLDTVELQGNAAPQIRLGDLEVASIPTHAVFREAGSLCSVAVTVTRFWVERELYRPIVRDPHLSPACFCQVGEIGSAVSEVLVGVCRVTKMELPRSVQRDALTGGCAP